MLTGMSFHAGANPLSHSLISYHGAAEYDSLLPERKIRLYNSPLPERNFNSLHAMTLFELSEVEKNFKQSGNTKKTMLTLLRIAGMKKSRWNNSLGARIFLNLAGISIRQKMYPVAMKCFSQAVRLN